MVVTGKPITKYCCSDTTQTEARIIALFSIFTTIFCLLVLFITFSQVKGEFFHSTKSDILNIQKLDPKNNESTNCFKVLGRLNLDSLNLKNTSKSEHFENSHNVTENSTITKIDDNFENETTTENSKQNISIESESSEVSTTRGPLDTELYMLRVKESRRLNENLTTIETEDEDENNENEMNDTTTSAKLTTFGNITLFEDETILCTESIPTKNKKDVPVSTKSQQRSQLDLMAEFLLWDANTKFKWIFLPFLWNIVDLTRGLLLLLALRKRNAALAKLWWHLTAITCLTGIFLFVPIVISLSNTEFIIIFILMFILVLGYNFYGMWIVNSLVADITSVATMGQYNNGFESEKIQQIEVIPVESFRVTFQGSD